MEKKYKLWINILLYLALFLVLLLTVSNNMDKKNEILLLSTILLASVSVRYLFLYENTKYYNYGQLNIVLEVAVTISLCMFDKYSVSAIIFLILMGDSIIFYKKRFSLFIAAIIYVAYLLTKQLQYGHLGNNAIWEHMIIFTVSIVFVACVMLFIKYLLSQRSMLLQTMDELQRANRKLTDTTEKLAELARLQERNRIAMEVHDTVGHTITTVLVQIEAGMLKIGKDNLEAVKTLKLATEQGRRGLSELRMSIGKIKHVSSHSGIGFIASLETLLDETAQYGNLKIEHELKLATEPTTELGDAVIKSIREGITNSLRHGKCTEIDLKVFGTASEMTVILSDNGSGCSQICFGFGLQGIIQRMDEFNGKLELASEQGAGFQMKLTVPLI